MPPTINGDWWVSGAGALTLSPGSSPGTGWTEIPGSTSGMTQAQVRQLLVVQTGIRKPPKAAATPPPKAAANLNLRQPPFDPRIYSLAFPMSGDPNNGAGGAAEGLARGWMQWDSATSSDTALVNFLYNPTTVSASYSMDDPNLAASVLYRLPGDTAKAAFALNQSVTFDLFFDRTFELWGSYQQSPGQLAPFPTKPDAAKNFMDPSVYGVNVDILAMKQLSGMMSGTYKTGGSISGGNPGITQQGVMAMTPSWLFFGAVTGMVYYGYVSGFSVTVTHFSQYMVPMRCVISVSFSLMPPTDSTVPSLGAWQTFATAQTAAWDNYVAHSVGKSGR